MKRLVLASALVFTALPAFAQLSITFAEPGAYGRIDIGGDMPRPELIEQKPILVDRVASGPPVYLRVPMGYEKHWKRNCAQYRACGYPVYFVRDDWYRRVYEPRYRSARAERAAIDLSAERRSRKDRDDGDDRRDDKRDDRDRGKGDRGDDRGRGR